MNLIEILEKNGIPAYVSGSFADDESFPDPVWIFTNMMTTNYSSDNNVQIEVLRYTLALYSSNPDGLREKVKSTHKELIQAGALCGGIVELRLKNPTSFGYGFECDVIQEY